MSFSPYIGLVIDLDLDLDLDPLAHLRVTVDNVTKFRGDRTRDSGRKPCENIC